MAYVEILASHGITQKQWDKKVYQEYIRMAFWPLFVGKNEGSVIQLKTDLQKGKGDTFVFELVGELEGGIVTGNSKGIGNEGSFEIYTDSVTIDNVRILAKLKNIQMSKQRSGLDLLNLAKSRISRKAKTRFDDEVTTAISDTSNGRVRDRYLYGRTDSNWNATHATALTAVDDTNDQLTLKSLSVCKRKALIPAYVSLPKIMPVLVKGNAKQLEEWFMYVNHGLSIRDLVEKDATFVNRQLNLPPNKNSDSPLYTGRHFKGSHDGILIYEYEGINLISSTIQCAHGLFLGAQAVGLAIGQGAKFSMEEGDLGHEVSAEIHEIRGIEKLAFDTDNAEDHGVVHHFTAAVAD